MSLNESLIEDTVIAWLESLGYRYISGFEIAPEELSAERENYGQVILQGKLRAALERINPKIPVEALEDAFRKVTRPSLPSLVGNNRAFHKMLVDGVDVEYRKDGRIVGGKAWVIG